MALCVLGGRSRSVLRHTAQALHMVAKPGTDTSAIDVKPEPEPQAGKGKKRQRAAFKGKGKAGRGADPDTPPSDAGTVVASRTGAMLLAVRCHATAARRHW